MSVKPRFLVLLKPREEQPALDRASQYARMAPDIEVVACRIINDFTDETKDQLKTKAESEFEAYKRKYTSIQNFSLKVIFNKNVAETFVSEARHGDYSLAIISANKRNAIRDLFVSTMDSTIMRQCYIPLLVVKSVKSHQELGQAILIAVDFNDTDYLKELDDYLVKSAKLFSENFNGEVHLVNCIAPLNRGLMSGNTGRSKIIDGTGAADVKRLQAKAVFEFARTHDIPDLNVHIIEGRIDEEIPRLCKKLNARMVCMGTSPRSSFFGTLDSIASELILEQIAGDVFVVNSVHASENK